MQLKEFEMLPELAFRRLGKRLMTLEGGGGGSTKSTSTTLNYSPEEAKRRTAVMDEAGRIYDQTAGQIASSPYPGSQVIPFSPETLASQQWGTDFATQSMPGMNQMLMDATQFGLTGAMDVNNNPYLSNAIDAAIRPITQDYLDPNGVFQRLRGEAVQNGGYGTSSRQALGEGIAAGRYAQSIGDTAGKLANEGYLAGLDTFTKTLGLTPATIQAMQTPMNILSSIGAQRENLAQLGEDYNSAARLWELNASWAPLQNWANIVFGAGSGGTSSSLSQPAAQRNPIGGAIGGAATGYALGAQIGSGFGPVGAIGGAILGGLFM
jgi:hypothetical protein